MIQPVPLENCYLGPGYPCFIVAEAGVNHNGQLATGLHLIDAAAEAGADAVKFQSFITEELVTPNAQKAAYQTAATKGSGQQFDMLKALELSPDEHQRLKEHCDRVGILYLCTPYEQYSVDMIDRLEPAAFKIASTDTTNIPLLRYIAAKKRPVILSTGMCSLGEVELAVHTLQQAGLKGKIILLQCTSEYPAPMQEINLRAMATLESAFLCPVGFSDHTEGIGASPWSVSLGACMVEKHFTLDQLQEGPDHRASIEPHELRQLVSTVRDVESALGDGRKVIMPSEIKNKPKMQKSLVAIRNITGGERITENDIGCKRPGTGLPPSWYDRVVNKIAVGDIARNSLLTVNAVQWDE